MLRSSALLLGALLLVACSTVLAAEPKLADLKQDEPAFYVHANVDRTDRFYREGDPLRVSVVCESEAYIYVLYEQADGKVFQIFPNSVQANNKVAGNTEIRIPDQDDRFRWSIGAPYGKEVVTVIASKTPVDVLAEKRLRQSRFNPVSAKQVKEAVTSLQDGEPATWTETKIEIVTAARDAQAPKQGRRFGVFFGAAEYQFDAEVRLATGGKWGPNLQCSANNAIVMARLMKSMGHIDDFQLCVNSQSTRANLEKALTEWLPAVSRPGDTVFIMYCGHGGQMRDDNGDEKDGKDEYLLTHDYLDYGILEQLSKQYTEKTLPEELLPRLAYAAKLIEGAKTRGQIDDILTRATCVSDDLFGHWLQRLSGRQIMVILDTCHAGGFIVGEKTLAKPQAPTLDFLDSEIGRLKDLGQPDSALLGACWAQESSYSLRPRDRVAKAWTEASKGLGEDRVPENLAMFSYHLVDALVALPPPLDANQTYEHCRVNMAEFFEKYNADKNNKPLDPHTPSFYNYSKRPILLKP